MSLQGPCINTIITLASRSVPEHVRVNRDADLVAPDVCLRAVTHGTRWTVSRKAAEPRRSMLGSAMTARRYATPDTHSYGDYADRRCRFRQHRRGSSIACRSPFLAVCGPLRFRRKPSPTFLGQHKCYLVQRGQQLHSGAHTAPTLPAQQCKQGGYRGRNRANFILKGAGTRSRLLRGKECGTPIRSREKTAQLPILNPFEWRTRAPPLTDEGPGRRPSPEDPPRSMRWRSLPEPPSSASGSQSAYTAPSSPVPPERPTFDQVEQ